MSFEVNLEQPEERVLRQKQSHTQGEKLPALKNDMKNTLKPDSFFTNCHKYETENLPAEVLVQHVRDRLTNCSFSLLQTVVPSNCLVWP